MSCINCRVARATRKEYNTLRSFCGAPCQAQYHHALLIGLKDPEDGIDDPDIVGIQTVDGKERRLITRDEANRIGLIKSLLDVNPLSIDGYIQIPPLENFKLFPVLIRSMRDPEFLADFEPVEDHFDAIFEWIKFLDFIDFKEGIFYKFTAALPIVLINTVDDQVLIQTFQLYSTYVFLGLAQILTQIAWHFVRGPYNSKQIVHDIVNRLPDEDPSVARIKAYMETDAWLPSASLEKALWFAIVVVQRLEVVQLFIQTLTDLQLANNLYALMDPLFKQPVIDDAIIRHLILTIGNGWPFEHVTKEPLIIWAAKDPRRVDIFDRFLRKEHDLIVEEDDGIVETIVDGMQYYTEKCIKYRNVPCLEAVFAFAAEQNIDLSDFFPIFIGRLFTANDMDLFKAALRFIDVNSNDNELLTRAVATVNDPLLKVLIAQPGINIAPLMENVGNNPILRHFYNRYLFLQAVVEPSGGKKPRIKGKVFYY